MWKTHSLTFRDLSRSRNIELRVFDTGEWPVVLMMFLPDQTVLHRTLDYISIHLTWWIWKWASTACNICYGRWNIMAFYIPFRICHTVQPQFNKTIPDMKIPSSYPILVISTFSLHSNVDKTYFRFTRSNNSLYPRSLYSGSLYLIMSYIGVFRAQPRCDTMVTLHRCATQGLYCSSGKAVVQYPRHSVKNVIQVNWGAWQPQQPFKGAFRKCRIRGCPPTPQYCRRSATHPGQMP